MGDVMGALSSLLKIAIAAAAIWWLTPRIGLRLARVIAMQGYARTLGAHFRLPNPLLTLTAYITGALVGLVATWLLVPANALRAPDSWRSALEWWPFVLALVVAHVRVRAAWLDTKRRVLVLVPRNDPLRARTSAPPSQVRPADPPRARPVNAEGAPGPKNIVIFCDGTGNRADATEEGRPALTNAAKLYRAALDHFDSEWSQVTWYDAGVGTGTSSDGRLWQSATDILKRVGARTPSSIATIIQKARMMLELATGVGIIENITEGYTEIVRQYQPGDRIYLIGFSRGAYTARCIAGVIARCGLLRAEHIRFAADVVQLYRYRDVKRSDRPPVEQTRDRFHEAGTVTVHFLGLWDTVASLGLPLWGWWFRIANLWRNDSIGADRRATPAEGGLDTSPAAVCERVYHAISMDERRAQFFVTLFDQRRQGFRNARDKGLVAFDEQIIEQVWFRGSHGGVGGGYADSGLSDIPLDWMMRAAEKAGLRLRADSAPRPPGNALAEAHNELLRQRAWYLFGTWPRWHPCPRPEQMNGDDIFGRLHESVYHRAQHAAARRAARAQALGEEVPVDPEEMHFLDEGASVRIVVRADWVWNRTGVVFETGVLYRLQRAGSSTWQDKECGACGPEGQRRRRLRARLFGARRLPQAQWMELVLTIAHPRDWPLQELGGRALFRYLFREDPRELTQSLMPIGRHLAGAEGTAFVLNTAPGGMAYAFANDAWLQYENNSGAIELAITRLDARRRAELLTSEPAAMCHVVDRDGAWTLKRLGETLSWPADPTRG